MVSQEPTEPPPPYTANANVNASSSTTTNTPHLQTSTQSQDVRHLTIPSSSSHKARNGIPPSIRRSMEDESRPLPQGWLRQYDTKSHHQFFVDTSSNPPRSIWHHPYDDEEYMLSLSEEERERFRREDKGKGPTQEDLLVESSDEESHPHLQTPSSQRQGLPPRGHGKGSSTTTESTSEPLGKEKQPKGMHKLTRKMKDHLTSSTHEERVASRRKREEEERQAYAQHRAIRVAMSKAAETGIPQFIGKDREGRDVYVEPPYDGISGGIGRGYGGSNGYGYNPYGRGGPYGSPNARFLRPESPYARPFGYGYGGGYGLPLLGLGSGLLLGGFLF